MPRNLTASDRESLIRLASVLSKGSPERRAILAKLAQTDQAAEDFSLALDPKDFSASEKKELFSEGLSEN